jgi:hypothetical protein
LQEKVKDRVTSPNLYVPACRSTITNQSFFLAERLASPNFILVV